MKKQEFPSVTVEPRLLESETYSGYGKRYSTNDLIKAAEGLKPFPVPLATIDLHTMPFKIKDTYDIIWHMKNMETIDTSYPIIYDDMGSMCNGWHRIIKAILAGETTIMAVQLKEMPARCENIDD